MIASPLLAELIAALQFLPGVGPKSAQRIAFHLLEKHRDKARRLSDVLRRAADDIGQCASCRTFCETEICALCASPNRDAGLICVVESPLDVQAIEQAADFRGRFFVLLGRLSPIDGVTPETLGMPLLEQRLAGGEVREMVVATGTTMEGEATAHYLRQIAQRAGVRATRIAYGVPVGGDLEFVDGSTLSHALASRRDY
ncbi:MAG: recombination mediator RecR [Gammaproteobacteria bacterium]|nr:recombination mediator RecR [Gammaproteobacteria bacterium]